MRLRHALALLGAAAAAFHVPAPAAAQDAPADVVAGFFKAVAEERWRDAARFLDVAALDRFRRERIAAARLPQERPRPVSADELMRQNPDMPPAVAEYQARKMNEAARAPFTWVEWEFADVSSIDSLAALSPEEAAMRWLQARDLRWRTRWAARKSRDRGCVVPDDVTLSLPRPSDEILGTVRSDSSTAFVLSRSSLHRRADPDVDADLDDDGPRVIALRRRGGRWLILPRGNVLHGGALGITFMGPGCREPTR